MNVNNKKQILKTTIWEGSNS